jgi:hypothetical protein
MNDPVMKALIKARDAAENQNMALFDERDRVAALIELNGKHLEALEMQIGMRGRYFEQQED